MSAYLTITRSKNRGKCAILSLGIELTIYCVSISPEFLLRPLAAKLSFNFIKCRSFLCSYIWDVRNAGASCVGEGWHVRPSEGRTLVYYWRGVIGGAV